MPLSEWSQPGCQMWLVYCGAWLLCIWNLLQSRLDQLLQKQEFSKIWLEWPCHILISPTQSFSKSIIMYYCFWYMSKYKTYQWFSGLRTWSNCCWVAVFIYTASCGYSGILCFIFLIFPSFLTPTSLSQLCFLSFSPIIEGICIQSMCVCVLACLNTCKCSCSPRMGLILGWQEWRGSEHMCRSFNCGLRCLVLLCQHFLNMVQKSFQSPIILDSLCILKPHHPLCPEDFPITRWKK